MDWDGESLDKVITRTQIAGSLKMCAPPLQVPLVWKACRAPERFGISRLRAKGQKEMRSTTEGTKEARRRWTG